MAKATFFYDGEFVLDSIIQLSESESRHAVAARRLKAGEEVLLLNGKGNIAEAILLDGSNKKNLSLRVTAVNQSPPSSFKLEIAVAMPKGDRQKVMLDMLTQIGVTHITPLECEYSVSHFKDNVQQRWQRNLIESSKQCQRAWLPVINNASTPEQILQNNKHDMVLYCDLSGKPVFDCIDGSKTDLLVFIGPEGGFSESEFTLFENYKAQPIVLAPNILRTEAAAITAAAQLINLL